MRLLSGLWREEAGVVLSAELVILGTVAVIGISTGLTVVGSAVKQELQDVAYAIRSLDQSYTIPAQEGCGAWTAGSSFRQQPVEVSLQQLAVEIEKGEQEEKSQAERLKEQVEKQSQQSEQKKKPQSRSKKNQRAAEPEQV